jgi:hypothetical protein
MPTIVLIADDSVVMRAAIRRTPEEEVQIEIVGEASSFPMPEKRDFMPTLVRSQLQAVRTMAISFSNDMESKALAESYGAASLPDKMRLYTEMIPSIVPFPSGRTFEMPLRPHKPLRRSHAAWARACQNSLLGGER